MQQPAQSTPSSGVPGPSSRSFIPPALRYPSYRYYWLSLLASVSGYQMFRVAQAWFVYELTGSTLYLGYAALANAVPGIFFNLFGGVFADKLNKRMLVMSTQAINAGLVALLGLLKLVGVVEVWHIMVIVFLAGAVEAFDTPARQAIYPHLIDRKVMMSAVALNSSVWSSTRIVSPAVGGFIIAATNIETSFFVAAAGFAVMAVVMLLLQVPPIPRGGRGNPAQDLMEGLGFIRKNSIFSFLITMTFFNSLLGMSYIFMIPAFAQNHLDLGAGGYGTLLSASGVGSLLVTIWLGSRGNVNSKGPFIIAGALLFGLSLIAFGLTSKFLGYYYLALVVLFGIGAFTSAVNISIQSSLQMLVADAVRGRVMGFYGMTWSIQPLGGMLLGGLASIAVLGAPLAVAIGGLGITIFALGPALLNPKVRNLGALLTQTQPAVGATS